MDEIQAAILRVKLKRLDEWNVQRRAIAQLYHEHLPASITLVADPLQSMNHLFVVRTRDREDLAKFLLDHGITTKVHFPNPLHRLSGPWEGPRADSPGNGSLVL